MKNLNPNSHPEDTIAAISTPPGEGGIGIVRLSGPEAIAIVSTLFVPHAKSAAPFGTRRVSYGHIVDDAETLDEVLVNVMRAPNSYTREDVVEINCHGGATPLQAVLLAVLSRGARLAGPGEFTKRAFLNGRIDLVQAEAVIGRIRAQTRAGLRAASSAASGALSKALYAMRERLVLVLSQIEAVVDFPEDEIPDTVNQSLLANVTAVRSEMSELLRTAEAGRLFREGASIAIVGRPNVGKSSLFNALLRDARAIVTAIPGTTRDVLEEVINIKGIPARLLDTAGMHDATDEVEQIGIERARAALEQADAAVFVIEAGTEPHAHEYRIAEEILRLETPSIVAVNKIDLAPGATSPAWALETKVTCRVSAKTGEGLGEFENALAMLLLKDTSIAPEQSMLTRVHQRESLRRAYDALGRFLEIFGASPEFLSIELQDALQAIGEITGETTPDEILEHVFASFCIGK